ncbi:MAG: DUF3488 and transglutaminase-like domain-containing protein [Nitrospiraceae bacterium]|nr:DUF3488 and transglutaminase-like domain-containing protein [Nitrospiraceae bacterium]
MPRIYKALTIILAFTGCIGLITTGELNPLMIVAGTAIIPGYIRFWKDKPALTKLAVGSLSISVLLVFILDSLLISGEIFIAVAHLTIIFQALKSYDIKEPWDHLQVYFMSLLQLIIASELTQSGIFGIIFIVFLITLVAAMVISHFTKEGTLKKIKLKAPVTAITVITLIVTVVFFIAAPRLQGGFGGKHYKKSVKTSGFSNNVSFGSFGEIKLNHEIIMRAEMSKNLPFSIYWRGVMLNYFDGISWQNTFKKRYRIYRDKDIFELVKIPEEKILTQKIFVEPLDSDVIFGIGTISRIEMETRVLFADYGGGVYTHDKSYKRLNYVIYSTLEEQTATEQTYDYLNLPSELIRTADFARRITRGINKTIDKAVKIENYLKANYRYSLKTPPPPEDMNPIEDFLFNTKQGYCEHYATSMALMLRALGIPSRIVTGFLNGEKNEYGNYIIVRQSDAHSWVEAVIDGKWKRFDPTPPAPPTTTPSAYSLFLDSLRMKWYSYVVSFSSADQKQLFSNFSLRFSKLKAIPKITGLNIRKLLVIILITAGAAFFFFVIKRVKRTKYSFITQEYLKFKKFLKRKGAKINQSSTPSDILKEASRLGIGHNVSEFISLYQIVRFGKKELNNEEKNKYKNLILY